jgi:uncharacterized coiled-coil protein SlyX
MSPDADPDAAGAPLAELAERLVDLEVRLAYQDRTVAALDEVIRTLTARVGVLEQELETLRTTVEHGEPVGPASDPPPHY